MENLKIGAIVKKFENDQMIMITGKFPLYNHQGNLGYFDYVGVAYPRGEVNGTKYYFNNQDVSDVIYGGFETNKAEKLSEKLMNKKKVVSLPKFYFNVN